LRAVQSNWEARIINAIIAATGFGRDGTHYQSGWHWRVRYAIANALAWHWTFPPIEVQISNVQREEEKTNKKKKKKKPVGAAASRQGQVFPM